MVHVREKTCKATEQFKDSNLPCSEKLKKFVIESRKYQTLYSNYEKDHRSKEFHFHEVNLIEEFVAQTLLFNGCCEVTEMLKVDKDEIVKNITEGMIKVDKDEIVKNITEGMIKVDKDEIVKNITEGMIKESRKFNCKVHVSIIWVYYFVYNGEVIVSLPVFKIYKDGGSNAVYLDTSLKVHQTWDRYLDDPGLGESLLCVPKNGEYHFDGNLLNLEYVLSKGKNLECESSALCCGKNDGPLSRAAAWPWIRKIQSWLSEHPVILEAVNKFLNFFKKHGHTVFHISAAVLFAYFTPGLNAEPAFLFYCKIAVQILFLCLDSEEIFGDLDCKKMLLSGIETAVSTYKNVHPEAETLSELLRNPRKNWREILKTFFCLIQKCNDTK